MSHRLQVLIPEELDRRLSKAAQRQRISKGELVRRALEQALQQTLRVSEPGDPLEQLKSLEAPTGDIAEVLSEIDAGRV